jgi:enhancing lycopene biosynthesis protein 2
MAASVAVVLSGCGYLDGSEIQESVFALYFLDRAGAKVQCFAPDRAQMHVVDHLTGDVSGESRNVLHEAARIARGRVLPLAEAQMDPYDALVLPGGFGAAKNLSDFALSGASANVDPDLVRLVGAALSGRKPICAICISPAILAAALARLGSGARLTIGDDGDTAAAIEQLGSTHVNCPVERAVIDEERRIITTPGYMYSAGPAGVASGIEQAIDSLMRWL